MKKLLPLLALMLALICVITACGDKDDGGDGHIHSFSEWETVKEPSFTEKGQKQRSCSCGEIQTQDIPMLVDSNKVDGNTKKYNEALALIEAKDYEGAKKLFEELGDYRDAKEKLDRFAYVVTKATCADDASSLQLTFNEKGLPTQVVTSNGGDIPYACTNDYTYDANGNLIKMVFTNDYYTATTNYTYDANGNLIKMVDASSDGDDYICDYTYDANGNLIKMVETYYDDFTSTISYIYDANGNLIKSVQSDSDNDTYTTEYTYDTNGNLIKESGGNTSSTEYTYDANGNLIQKAKNNSFLGSTTTYNYDINGNLFKEVYIYNGNTYTTEYIYDANGSLIKEVYTTSNGYSETTQFEYEYKLVYLTYDLPEFYQETLDNFWG